LTTRTLQEDNEDLCDRAGDVGTEVVLHQRKSEIHT
jgi:hypothetical protein